MTLAACGSGSSSTCQARGATNECGTSSDGGSQGVDGGPQDADGGSEGVDGGCTPKTCSGLLKNCGAVSDGCGGMLSCGDCYLPSLCGWGGAANRCGTGSCIQETDAEFCTRLAKNCGPVTARDNCDTPRTVASCGACVAPETCGGVVGVCGSRPGWTRVTSPTTNALNALWGSAEDDVWAVGAKGTILHWQGSTWTQVHSPTTDTLYAIWGSSAKDVWIVGGLTTLRWQGSSWEKAVIPISSAYGIWGSSASDIWIVGANAAHWLGSLWAEVFTDTSPTTIYGARSNDVWGVGGNGHVSRWQGSNWTGYPSPTSSTLAGVWVSSSSDVWIVADEVWRRHDTSWSRVVAGGFGGFKGVWGTSAENVWVVGDSGTILRLQGASWFQFSSPTTSALRGVWGSSPDDLWAVGEDGTILRRH